MSEFGSKLYSYFVTLLVPAETKNRNQNVFPAVSIIRGDVLTVNGLKVSVTAEKAEKARPTLMARKFMKCDLIMRLVHLFTRTLTKV